jgi:hypothetical protein
LQQLNSQSLAKLNLANNNLQYPQLADLSCFTDLDNLDISNGDYYSSKNEQIKSRISNGIYNRINGNLDDLINLDLNYLNISNTDISSGITALSQ